MYYDIGDAYISNSSTTEFDSYGRSGNKANNGAGASTDSIDDRFIQYFNSISNGYSLTHDDQCYTLILEPAENDSYIEDIAQIIPTTISVNDAVSILKNRLGVSAAMIAEMAGVSRATLYNHMSLSNDVSSFDSQYQRVFDIAVHLKENDLTIKNGLKSVMVDNKTIINHLKNKELKTNVLISYIDQVAEKLATVKLAKRLSIEEERYLLSNT